MARRSITPQSGTVIQVEIREVDMANHVAHVRDKMDGDLIASIRDVPNGGQIPATGEQWSCERIGFQWYLKSRLSTTDETIYPQDAGPGDAVMQATSRVILEGTEGLLFNGVVFQDVLDDVDTKVTMPQVDAEVSAWAASIGMVTPIPWTQLPLLGNPTGAANVGTWWNYAVPFGPVMYMRDAMGTVFIKGLAQYHASVGSNYIVDVGGLPVGCRPSQTLMKEMISSAGGGRRVDILANGAIFQHDIPLNAWVSLDMSFKAEL